MEKRRSRRVRKRLPITLGDGIKEHVGVTRDLSETGLCVLSPLSLATGARVTACLALPDGEEVWFQAIVRWARAGKDEGLSHTMGLHFVDPPGESYEKWLGKIMETAPLVPESVPEAKPSRAGTKAPRKRTSKAPRGAASSVKSKTPKTKAQNAGALTIELLDPGLEGHATKFVTAEDLALPADVYSCSLSAGRAAQWAEEAAVRAVVAKLPADTQTIWVSMALNVWHSPPTPIGAKVVTSAKLVKVSPIGDSLTFEVVIKEGVRPIASGTHMRTLIDARRGT